MKSLENIKKSKTLNSEQELVVIVGTGKGSLAKDKEFKVGNKLADELVKLGRAKKK